MIEYYQKRAKEYEQIYQKEERLPDLQLISHYLLEQFKDAQLLDVGCGTGYWSAIIAQTAHSILGIDINEEVLQIARSKDYHATPTRFQQLDYHQLFTLNGSYNGIFCGFVWSHIYQQKQAKFAQLLLSKLEQEGRLIIIDNQFVTGSNTPISRTDKLGNTYQLRQLNNGETYEVLKNFPKHESLAHLFKHHVSYFQWKALEYYWICEMVK